jgi:hypothetical protein
VIDTTYSGAFLTRRARCLGVDAERSACTGAYLSL